MHAAGPVHDTPLRELDSEPEGLGLGTMDQVGLVAAPTGVAPNQLEGSGTCQHDNKKSEKLGKSHSHPKWSRE